MSAFPTKSRLGLCAALAILLSAPDASSQTVFGTPIPVDAAPLTPTEVFHIYAGKSESWGSGSGAYWNSDGTFYAVNSAEESIGVGKWYVTTAGRVCSEGKWYWRQDFGVEDRRLRTCTRFRRDGDGDLWTTTEGLTGPWFPFEGDNFSRGNIVSSSFTGMVEMLGLQGVVTRN